MNQDTTHGIGEWVSEWGSVCDETFFGGSSNGIPITENTSSGTSTSWEETCPLPCVHRQPQPVVAKQEQKAVSRSKALVFAVLLLAVSAVATTMYLLVMQEQTNEFRGQFAQYSSEIETVVYQNIENLFGATDSLSVQLAAHAIDTNSTWPFVTLTHWPVIVDQFVKRLGRESLALGYTPIVKEEQRGDWANYISKESPVHYKNNLDYLENRTSLTFEELMTWTNPNIHYINQYGQKMPIDHPGDALPIWQRYPLETGGPFVFTSLDVLSSPNLESEVFIVNSTLRPSITFDVYTRKASTWVLQPIFEGVDTGKTNNPLVGIVWLNIEWIDFLQDILPKGVNNLAVVLEGSCPQRDPLTHEIIEERKTAAFMINGNDDATLLEDGFVPNPRYDDMKVSTTIVDLDFDQSTLSSLGCVPIVTMNIYPTDEFENAFYTSKAPIYTSMVVAIFLFTSLVFLLYDHFVGRSQRLYMNRIITQEKIVSNVFPAAIRDRLYQNERGQQNQESARCFDVFDPLDFLDGSIRLSAAPLADLFPNTTVAFADIAGFTAWASAREPQQVFLLLEHIFGAFDKIACRYNVFKVETVGDCYVTVSGLPEACEHHSSNIANFAQDAMKKMRAITRKLEVSLGPDTADLAIRIGIHSGQVTAGVLRGQRSRFQLFGDTVNTAARMESSGQSDCIQISQTTAELLIKDGWVGSIMPRMDKIFVKGKGNMQTYWLQGIQKGRKSCTSMSTAPTKVIKDPEYEGSSDSDSFAATELINKDYGYYLTKSERLVEWSVEILSPLLQQIVASRDVSKIDEVDLTGSESELGGSGNTILEEFIPIVALKRFKEDELQGRRRPSTVSISDEATSQLREYLTNAASMYRDNAFHNFEHAAQVAASVKKLLKRIVNVDEGKAFGMKDKNDERVNLEDLAGHSYGITSDPLTQFAVVFSAIVHDLDHPGVPNTQLVKENTRTAQLYKKSIAEQTSVNLAWNMLMRNEYQELRKCIYQTEDDLKRFRQLVVNTVLATDIVDKELQALRNARWETAFSKIAVPESMVESEDRKATIVIEHLIQASDVSHTMQHWHVYKKWNEKYFMECYGAYKSGRADSDPSTYWYKNEIGFLTFYVIPLAKKLDSCGVFGVSSDEYMNYAISNREEWEREGEMIVQKYISKFEETVDDSLHRHKSKFVVSNIEYH